MTVEAIKHAVEELSEAELFQFAEWVQEMKEQAWDRQIEKDFAPGGRAEPLVARLDREIAAGNFSSLEEGFRQRTPHQKPS